MRTFEGIDALRAAVGETIGTSDWLVVDQERVNRFAEATGDHQWIHVDPERAASGPFGTTIAHGYLTLSLLPVLVQNVYSVQGVRMAVNYGCNRVRFPSPTPVGSRVRAVVRLDAVDDVAGGVQNTATVTIEREGGEKPVCVAETVSRLYV